MKYDHEAIYKAYSEVKMIRDDDGAYDANDKKVTLDQSLIDAARNTLNTEAAAIAYQSQRRSLYPSLGDQFDLLWHAIDADDDLIKKFPAFHAAILAVKSKYPSTK